jgi:TolB protein
VQFTDGPDTELMPAWSPDGSQMAFAATKDIDTGPSDIYVVNADGSELQLLTPTDDCGSVPSWSPDGQSLLYVGGTCGEEPFLFTMNRDGGNVRQLNQDQATWPDWSSDGRIIYEALSPDSNESALLITDNQAKHPTRLNTDDLPSGTEATWSPDGSRIAYVAPTGDPESGNPQDWNEDIFVINADGTDGRQVVSTPGNDHWPPAWSPNGERLLYTADGVGDSAVPTLAVVDLETLRVTPFAADACPCALPDWRR